MTPVRTPAPRRATSTPSLSTTEVELAGFGRALGHPARVAIVRMLIESGECVCGGIVERLPLAQATVSQHLKVLKASGLVRGEIDGPRVCYCIDPAAVQRFQELAAALSEPSPPVAVPVQITSRRPRRGA